MSKFSTVVTSQVLAIPWVKDWVSVGRSVLLAQLLHRSLWWRVLLHSLRLGMVRKVSGAVVGIPWCLVV